MKIKITKEYKSLLPFELDNLPSFVIISGVNGSGKSQLLNGIITKEKPITVTDNINRLLLAKKVILVPNDDSGFKSENLKKNIQILYTAFSRYKQDITEGKERNIITYFGTQSSLDILNQIAISSKKEIHLLEEDDFNKYYPINLDINKKNIFHHSLSTIFMSYHINNIRNDFNEFRNHKYGRVPFLEKKEFIKKFGEPPWTLMNKIIKEANLDYTLNQPITEHEDTSFQVKLTNKISNAEINFNELSGGEKVIMSLVLALYNSNLDYEFPDLLLMDEPDAPLHPEMTKQFLNVIKNVFVKEFGIHVIITTHSASTIALAPEGSIYIMQKEEPRLIKAPKDKALKNLTSGIPSLSINYDYRRQVFVESKYDVYFYEKVFTKLNVRNYLKSEVSLQFISSGVSGSGNCDQVKDSVNTLRNIGNQTVYGIIDWDLQNNESDYVKVLGKEKRYSIENYIFDPILLAIFLLRETHITKTDLELNETENFLSFKEFDSVKLQNICDYILSRIETSLTGELDRGRDKCLLINEKTIMLPKWFLQKNGHDLEIILKSTFPELNRYRKEGDLKKEIIVKVIEDIPDVLSQDLVDLFSKIQQ